MTVNPAAAFIGIGSNLDDPAVQIRSALDAIERLDEVSLESRSSLYSSPPMGPPDQPDYVNAVIEIRTSLPGSGLLDLLQEIELRHGRVRQGARWGPRTLDLDILFHGSESIVSERLTIPHPGVCDRAFVLIPLAEIAPDLILPNGKTALQSVAALTGHGVSRLDR